MNEHVVLLLVVIGMISLLNVLARYWPPGLGLFGAVLFLFGQGMGLFWAPREAMMGDVGRILYVHVPAAWLALVAYTVAFVYGLRYLFTSADENGRMRLDSMVEGSVEVGVVLNGLLLCLGSIFARPTWGTWWTWDPRLTASAIMFVTFVGVMLLRSIVDDPDRRGLWTSVATVIAFVNIPVTYMSVRWWPSIHQVQSSPDTMSPEMVLVLRINAFAFLFLMSWFISMRSKLSQVRTFASRPPPLPGEVPAAAPANVVTEDRTLAGIGFGLIVLGLGLAVFAFTFSPFGLVFVGLAVAGAWNVYRGLAPGARSPAAPAASAPADANAATPPWWRSFQISRAVATVAVAIAIVVVASMEPAGGGRSTAGVITGGWSYVADAYGLTWYVLIAYGLGLFLNPENPGGAR